MQAEQIKSRLLENFPDAGIELSDMTGGGDHWQLKISSTAFDGKSLVEQHQLVYRALGEWMLGPIHALALETVGGSKS